MRENTGLPIATEEPRIAATSVAQAVWREQGNEES